ncbi:MAG: choice-of-anchor L domain-containing protein, partial [Saprospiraceae bacterium]
MKITPFRKQFASPTHFLAVLLLLSLPSFLIAQVQVTPATGGIFTPESLITNVFLGDGVEVTAVSFNGDPVSVGYFTDGAANLNIDRGILMTTGTATDAIGPNDATGNGSTTTNMVSDPDLNAISTAGLQDVSTYEITFIPTSDTLRFRYVFASEEYPEYACTGFNDVFGFFITGPNPAGGMYNAQNIARVPDPSDPSGLTFTNDPVTINMVNPGTPGTAGGTVANCSPPGGSLAYSQYYNASAANDPFMQYDGYLNAFVAQAIVIPCQTYTMKLGVADAGDTNFDTAVFLEAKSFGTGSLAVEATTLSLDGTITESCVEGTITFRLPNAIEDDYTIDYNIFGTATNGVDYATIPTTLTIPAGDTAVSFPLIAFEDGITEGIESIAFDVQRDPCNRDTFYVYIRDNEIVPPELGPDLTICKNDPGVQLDGTLPIVLPDPPTFTNSVGYDPIVTISDNNPPPTGTPPTIAPLQVFAVQPFTLAEGVIKSVCINVQHNWIDDIDIFLVSPGGQFLELTTDNGGDGNNYFQTCFTPDATVPINFPGPAAPASAAPFTGNFQPEGLWSDLYDGDNPTNGTWQLLIKDDQTGLDGRLFDWSMCFTPLYQVFYEWTPSAGLSCADCPDPIASPDTTTTYTLTAFDTYGCEVYDTITINVIEDLPAPILSCGTPTDNSVTVEWPPVTSATGYEVNVNGSGWLGSSGANSHTVSGLALNTCVDVEVRGVGSCDGLIDTITCCTPNCVPPVASIDALTNVNCFGGMDGTVDVSAMGNAFIAEYNLAGNTNTTGIFTGLSAGNYTVSITDQVMCTTQIDFTITQPDTLIVTPILIDS